MEDVDSVPLTANVPALAYLEESTGSHVTVKFFVVPSLIIAVTIAGKSGAEPVLVIILTGLIDTTVAEAESEITVTLAVIVGVLGAQSNPVAVNVPELLYFVGSTVYQTTVKFFVVPSFISASADDGRSGAFPTSVMILIGFIEATVATVLADVTVTMAIAPTEVDAAIVPLTINAPAEEYEAELTASHTTATFSVVPSLNIAVTSDGNIGACPNVVDAVTTLID